MAKWFDEDCRQKKLAYSDAPNAYNTDKSNENRHNLCDKKKVYKNAIRRKRRRYQFEEM